MDQSTAFNESPEPSYIPTSDEKTAALLAHVLTIVTWFFAPLLIYLLKKDDSPFVAAHAKESLNFQITITIACIALAITLVGILFMWVIGVIGLIFVIVATIKASEGKPYRYPLCIRLIK